MALCRSCSREIANDARFCPHCGRDQTVLFPATNTIQTPSYPVPQPPPSRGSSPLRWVGIGLGGCLGLVVLSVVFVGCLAVLGSVGGQQASDGGRQAPRQAQSDAPAQGSEEQPERQPTAQVGDTVKVGNVAWQVTNAQQTSALKSQFGSRPKRGNFVIVDFLFTNNGNEAVTLDTISLTLKDERGRKFEPDTDTFEYVPARKDIFLTQVNPGVSQEGRVIFTVAPDASGFTLHAGDLDFWSNKSAHIGLGF